VKNVAKEAFRRRSCHISGSVKDTDIAVAAEANNAAVPHSCCIIICFSINNEANGAAAPHHLPHSRVIQHRTLKAKNGRVLPGRVKLT